MNYHCDQTCFNEVINHFLLNLSRFTGLIYRVE